MNDNEQFKKVMTVAAFALTLLTAIISFALAIGEQKNVLEQNIALDQEQELEIEQCKIATAETSTALMELKTDIKYIRNSVDENRADVKELMKK